MTEHREHKVPRPEAWEPDCIWVLSAFLARREERLLHVWIRLHVDGSKRSWFAYAMLLASIAASAIEDVLPPEMKRGRRQLVTPGSDPEDGDGARDAVRLVTMYMNDDLPGAQGVLEAWYAGEHFRELLGFLAGIASAALSSTPIHREGGG